MKNKKNLTKFYNSVKTKHKHLLKLWHKVEKDMQAKLELYATDIDSFNLEEANLLLDSQQYRTQIQTELEYTTKILQVLLEYFQKF